MQRGLVEETLLQMKYGKAYAPFAANTGNLEDLARMTNLMTGVLSMQNLGYGSTKRNLLNCSRFLFATVHLCPVCIDGAPA